MSLNTMNGYDMDKEVQTNKINWKDQLTSTAEEIHVVDNGVLDACGQAAGDFEVDDGGGRGGRPEELVQLRERRRAGEAEDAGTGEERPLAGQLESEVEKRCGAGGALHELLGSSSSQERSVEDLAAKTNPAQWRGLHALQVDKASRMPVGYTAYRSQAVWPQSLLRQARRQERRSPAKSPSFTASHLKMQLAPEMTGSASGAIVEDLRQNDPEFRHAMRSLGRIRTIGAPKEPAGDQLAGLASRRLEQVVAANVPTTESSLAEMSKMLGASGLTSKSRRDRAMPMAASRYRLEQLSSQNALEQKQSGRQLSELVGTRIETENIKKRTAAASPTHRQDDGSGGAPLLDTDGKTRMIVQMPSPTFSTERLKAGTGASFSRPASASKLGGKQGQDSREDDEAPDTRQQPNRSASNRNQESSRRSKGRVNAQRPRRKSVDATPTAALERPRGASSPRSGVRATLGAPSPSYPQPLEQLTKLSSRRLRQNPVVRRSSGLNRDLSLFNDGQDDPYKQAASISQYSTFARNHATAQGDGPTPDFQDPRRRSNRQSKVVIKHEAGAHGPKDERDAAMAKDSVARQHVFLSKGAERQERYSHEQFVHHRSRPYESQPHNHEPPGDRMAQLPEQFRNQNIAGNAKVATYRQLHTAQTAPATEEERQHQLIDQLEEVIAAGKQQYAGGLSPADSVHRTDATHTRSLERAFKAFHNFQKFGQAHLYERDHWPQTEKSEKKHKVTLPQLRKYQGLNESRESLDKHLRAERQALLARMQHLMPEAESAMGLPHMRMEAHTSCRVQQQSKQIGLKQKLRLIQSMDRADYRAQTKEIKALREDTITKNQSDTLRDQAGRVASIKEKFRTLQNSMAKEGSRRRKAGFLQPLSPQFSKFSQFEAARETRKPRADGKSPDLSQENVIEELADAFKAQALEGVFSSRKLASVKYRHFLWTEALQEQLAQALRGRGYGSGRPEVSEKGVGRKSHSQVPSSERSRGGSSTQQRLQSLADALNQYQSSLATEGPSHGAQDQGLRPHEVPVGMAVHLSATASPRAAQYRANRQAFKNGRHGLAALNADEDVHIDERGQVVRHGQLRQLVRPSPAYQVVHHKSKKYDELHLNEQKYAVQYHGQPDTKGRHGHAGQPHTAGTSLQDARETLHHNDSASPRSSLLNSSGGRSSPSADYLPQSAMPSAQQRRDRMANANPAAGRMRNLEISFPKPDRPQPHYTKPTNASLAARVDAAKNRARAQVPPAGLRLELPRMSSEQPQKPKDRHQFEIQVQTKTSSRDMSILKGDGTPVRTRAKEERTAELSFQESQMGKLFLDGQPCRKHTRDQLGRAKVVREDKNAMSNMPVAEAKDDGQRRQRQHQMNFDLKLITTQPCGDATPSGPLADVVDESKGGPSEGWQGTRQNISEPRDAEQPEDGLVNFLEIEQQELEQLVQDESQRQTINTDGQEAKRQQQRRGSAEQDDQPPSTPPELKSSEGTPTMSEGLIEDEHQLAGDHVQRREGGKSQQLVQKDPANQDGFDTSYQIKTNKQKKMLLSARKHQYLKKTATNNHLPKSPDKRSRNTEQLGGTASHSSIVKSLKKLTNLKASSRRFVDARLLSGSPCGLGAQPPERRADAVAELNDRAPSDTINMQSGFLSKRYHDSADLREVFENGHAEGEREEAAVSPKRYPRLPADLKVRLARKAQIATELEQAQQSSLQAVLSKVGGSVHGQLRQSQLKKAGKRVQKKKSKEPSVVDRPFAGSLDMNIEPAKAQAKASEKPQPSSRPPTKILAPDQHSNASQDSGEEAQYLRPSIPKQNKDLGNRGARRRSPSSNDEKGAAEAGGPRLMPKALDDLTDASPIPKDQFPMPIYEPRKSTGRAGYQSRPTYNGPPRHLKDNAEPTAKRDRPLMLPLIEATHTPLNLGSQQLKVQIRQGGTAAKDHSKRAGAPVKNHHASNQPPSNRQQSGESSASATGEAPTQVQYSPFLNRTKLRISPQVHQHQLPRYSAYYAIARDHSSLQQAVRTGRGAASPQSLLPFQTYSNGFMVAPSYHGKEVRGSRKINSKLSKVAARYKNILSHQTSLGRHDERTTGLEASLDFNRGEQSAFLEDSAPTYKFFDGVQNPLVLQQMNELEQPSHGWQTLQAQPSNRQPAPNASSVQATRGLGAASVNVTGSRSPTVGGTGGFGDLTTAMRDQIRKFGQMFNDGGYRRAPLRGGQARGKGSKKRKDLSRGQKESVMSSMVQSQDFNKQFNSNELNDLEVDPTLKTMQKPSSGSPGKARQNRASPSDPENATEHGDERSKVPLARRPERAFSKSALAVDRLSPSLQAMTLESGQEAQQAAAKPKLPYLAHLQQQQARLLEQKETMALGDADQDHLDQANADSKQLQLDDDVLDDSPALLLDLRDDDASSSRGEVAADTSLVPNDGQANEQDPTRGPNQPLAPWSRLQK